MFVRRRGSLLLIVMVAVVMAVGQTPLTTSVAAEPSAAEVAPASNGRLNEIIAAARKEGQLSIVVGEGTIGGSNSGLGEAFNKYYGLDLDIRFTPGPPMPNMVSAVIQQYQAHHAAVTDVIIGYANHMMALINADAIQKVDWKSWAPNLQQPHIVSSEGAAVPVMSSTPGIAYSTAVFQGDTIPKAFQDLLNPKLKGRVATTPYASSFDRLGTDDMWGMEKTLAFAHKLSEQVGGLIRCNEMDRIASGEFDAFGLTCSQTDALSSTSKGAPVAFTLASDAPIIMYLYQAVPQTAAHPNAAMLWINYLMSREAQDRLYRLVFSDLHLLDGSNTAQEIDRLEAKGVKFLIVDTDFYRSHNMADMDKTLTQVQAIFQNK